MKRKGLLASASSFLAPTIAVLFCCSAALADGHSITIVMSEEPDTLDPCEATHSFIGRIVKQNIVESLTEVNPTNGKIMPRLATSWEQKDAKTWHFNLRQGVTFHDGSKFNAETAAVAIKRALNPNENCQVREKFFSNIQITPSKVDEFTLEIKSETAQPILPTLMTTILLASPNTPAERGVRDPSGTGPYKLANWTPGQQVVVVQNSNYWGAKPQIGKATYLFRSESSVRAAMVKTGEADLAPNIALQDATDASMDISYPNSETSHLRIDITKAPLNDIRVRKAMNYAVDRNAMAGTIFSSDVEAATALVVPTIAGHNPSLKAYPYDPEKAKSLLAEAKADGVPVDKEILMVGRLGIYPNSTEAMEAIYAMLTDVGFNMKLQMVEKRQWVESYSKPYDEDRGPVLHQGQHDNNKGDPVFTVYFKYGCDGPQSTMCDKEVEQNIEAASAAPIGPDRVKIWQKVFKRLHEDIVHNIMMYHMVGYTRVGERIAYEPTIATNSEVQLAAISLK